MNNNSKFIIIPRGVFLSSLKNKLWLVLCDKLLVNYIFKLIKKKYNLGLLLILLTFYINELINLKLKHFKNFIKFYTKEERQNSLGNYYIFRNINSFSNNKHVTKFLKNELLFDLTNYIYFLRNPLDFDNYSSIMNQKINLTNLNLFNLKEN